MNAPGDSSGQPPLPVSGDPLLSLEQQVFEVFGQLRAVCPMAGMTSELAAPVSGSAREHQPGTGQAGLYIVKATILVGGIVVAGALGGAESLVLAEQQAQLRALALLGYGARGSYGATEPGAPGATEPGATEPGALGTGGVGPRVASLVHPGGANEAPAYPAPATTPESPTFEAAAAQAIEAQAVEAQAVEAQVVEADAAAVHDVAASSVQVGAIESPAPVAIEPSPKPKRGKPSKKSTEAAPRESVRSEAATPDVTIPGVTTPGVTTPGVTTPGTTIPAADPLLATPGISTDWSEELSQIAVELKRLSWTAKQEADYLLRTYGFASRDDIIEYDQLTDYLSYLRALPSHFLPDSTESPEDEAKTQFDWDALNVASSYPGPDDAVPVRVGYQPEEDITGSGDGFDPGIASLPKDFGGATAQAVQAQAVQAQPIQAQPIQAQSSRTPEVDPFPALESQDYSSPAYPLDDYSTSQEPFGQESFGDELSMSRSEMMERSAAECKRLKWTNRQGSDYLKATYGKPTRNDLTNQELWEFLQHLQSLSSTVEQLPF